MKKSVSIAIAGAALMSSGTAQAQVEPITRTVEVTFTGTVIKSAADTLIIRDADGNEMPFQGELPDYPVKVGDSFTYSYKANVPTQAYVDTFGLQVDSDGLSRLPIFEESRTGPRPGGFGNGGLTNIDEPFSIGSTITGGSVTNFHTLAIDPDTLEVFIDHEAGFTNRPYNGPVLVFNSESEEYELCNRCFQTIFENTGGRPDPFQYQYTLAGNEEGTELSLSSGVLATDGNFFTGEGTGFFSLLFSGDWSLPSLSSRGSSSGGAGTPVPAPPMMILFGLAAVAVLSRRKKATGSQ